MITTELYNGQGLGNQLWCYVVTRIIAEKNGYDYGIMGTDRFKGGDFLTLDVGKEVIGGNGPEGGPPISLPITITSYYKEHMEYHPSSRLDISKCDVGLLNVSDNTKVDGIMQSMVYIKNHREKISNWLKVDVIDDYSDDNICIIHLRGGDFMSSLAMLDSNYYNTAIEKMREINPDMTFYAVTDDVNTCRRILPNIQIVGSSTLGVSDNLKANHHLGGPIAVDYKILNNAKNVIMSASSFGWWPVWTNKRNPLVIAPKYWAAYKQSDGYWSTGESKVDEWKYLDRDGNIE
jgi:hypothetical protein